jgi:hypothetical protein
MLLGEYHFAVFLGDDACPSSCTGATLRGVFGRHTLICTVGTSRQNNPERSPGHHDWQDLQDLRRSPTPLSSQDRLLGAEITSMDSMGAKGILPEPCTWDGGLVGPLRKVPHMTRSHALSSHPRLPLSPGALRTRGNDPDRLEGGCSDDTASTEFISFPPRHRPLTTGRRPGGPE